MFQSILLIRRKIKYIIKDSQAAVVVINTGQLEKLQVPDAVNIIE
jgi:hypothetical protein